MSWTKFSLNASRLATPSSKTQLEIIYVKQKRSTGGYLSTKRARATSQSSKSERRRNAGPTRRQRSNGCIPVRQEEKELTFLTSPPIHQVYP